LRESTDDASAMEARSNDLRERVVAGWGRGEGTKAPLARRFAIGQDSVRRIIKRWEATDSVAAKRRGGDRRRKIVGDDHAALKQMPAEEPDATRERFQPRCHDELNIECSLMTLSREFKKMGLTFKKTLKAKEQHREDVQERRETFKSDIASIDPERFVFLDECGGMTNMTRMYGRSLKGARLVDHPPHGHWQNTRVIAAMRLDGGGRVDGARRGDESPRVRDLRQAVTRSEPATQRHCRDGQSRGPSFQ
jgi:transposase